MTEAVRDLRAAEAKATPGPWFFDGYCRVQATGKVAPEDEFWSEERCNDGHTYEHHVGRVCPGCGVRPVPGHPGLQYWDCARAGEALDMDPTVATVRPSAGDTARGQRVADAEFIALARNAAPTLLAAADAVERVRAALDLLASDAPGEMLVLPPEHHACEREVTRLIVTALRRALDGEAGE